MGNVASRISSVFERLLELERVVVLFDEIEEFVLDRSMPSLAMESRMLTTVGPAHHACTAPHMPRAPAHTPCIRASRARVTIPGHMVRCTGTVSSAGLCIACHCQHMERHGGLSCALCSPFAHSAHRK